MCFGASSSIGESELYILGLIENRTSGFIRNIHLAAAVFGGKPGPATEAERRIQGDELPSGERAPFVIKVPKPASYASFSL